MTSLWLFFPKLAPFPSLISGGGKDAGLSNIFAMGRVNMLFIVLGEEDAKSHRTKIFSD